MDPLIKSGSGTTSDVFVGRLAAVDKVPVCHVDENGNFKLLNLNERAVRPHLAHGDGVPGGAPYPATQLTCSTMTATK